MHSFREEMFGYSKEDVDQYLLTTLNRLESFEAIIENQKEEIHALEKKIANVNFSDNSEKIIEDAKKNADEIIENAIKNINDLNERIQKAILKELEK